jgi:hypothetical protein
MSDEFIPVIEDLKTEFPVRPKDIVLRGSDNTPIAGLFGKHELEVAAGRLVAFFQMRTKWSSFSIEELTNFFVLRKWDPNTMFFGLMGSWCGEAMITNFWGSDKGYIGYCGGGRLCVSRGFIEKCNKPIT